MKEVYKARLPAFLICERDFECDVQRDCLRNFGMSLNMSEESLGRDETPRQTSHEQFFTIDSSFIVKGT